MEKRWMIFLLSFLFMPVILFAQNVPMFFPDNEPVFHDGNGKSLGKVIWKIVLKEMGLSENKFIQQAGTSENHEISIPLQIIEKSIFPKVGEKLWVFHKSKLKGVLKVTKVVLGLDPNDSVYSVFWTDDPNRLGVFSLAGDPSHGMLISVPEGTSVENEPSEYVVDSTLRKRFLKQIHVQYPKAVIDQTFTAMGGKYITFAYDQGEDNTYIYVYKIEGDDFKEVFKKFICCID